MHSHSILDDTCEFAASVRVEHVAKAKRQRLIVVDGSSGGERLGGVILVKERKIGYLCAKPIYDAEDLPGTQDQRDGGLRRDLYEGARNGHFQLSSVGRPEYWRASLAVPNSRSSGLMLPCSCNSRPLTIRWMRWNLPSRRASANWSCELKTRVGREKRRDSRELSRCIPTTKKASLAKLKAKSF